MAVGDIVLILLDFRVEAGLYTSLALGPFMEPFYHAIRIFGAFNPRFKDLF